MSPAPAPAGSSPVTVRAVAIGLFLVVGINLVMLYNDYYLRNTPLILNHLPTAGTAVILALVLVANVALRGRRVLSQGEVLLIWSMVALGGGVGSTGFWRGVAGFMASPAYYATPSNEYATYLVAHLPDWMVVSKDPDSKVLRWYFEGLPRGQSIPWGAWIVPILGWGAFGLSMYAFMFAATSLFYRQWAERERLTFPIVQLPVELTRPAEPGHRVNAFFRSRLVWCGAAVPILVYGNNGLRSYVPGLPQIPLDWGTWGWFPDRPWSEFNLGWAHTYFAIVGLSFLLTAEMSFSLWFFYVAYHLSFVGIAAIGASGGYFANWNVNSIVFQSAGGIFATTAFLIWIARKSLRDPSRYLLPRTLTLGLLAAGMAGVTGWVCAAGGQWWAAILGSSLFLSVIIVLTRLVVEGGMLLIGVEAIAYEFLCGLFPAAWLRGPTLASYVSLRGGLMSDLRELVMPYLMNGVRACEAAGMKARPVLGVFALTILVAFAAAGYGRIATGYKYGAMQGDVSYNLGWQSGLYVHVTKFLKSPPAYEWVTLGAFKVLPVSVAHTLTGAVVAGGMLALRSAVSWWPLAPWGYLVAGGWPMEMIWFSVLLGWIAKSTVMTFGGAVVYRRWLPFFLGLVLGQALIATFWTVVSLFTGAPGIYMLPD